MEWTWNVATLNGECCCCITPIAATFFFMKNSLFRCKVDRNIPSRSFSRWLIFNFEIIRASTTKSIYKRNERGREHFCETYWKSWQQRHRIYLRFFFRYPLYHVLNDDTWYLGLTREATLYAPIQSYLFRFTYLYIDMFMWIHFKARPNIMRWFFHWRREHVASDLCTMFRMLMLNTTTTKNWYEEFYTHTIP